MERIPVIPRSEACRYLLDYQGLGREVRFSGKSGVMEFIRQAGCIQFDPIDVCGRNADLVLQSRVEGYSKSMLTGLLYEDRELVDYFDKNLSIFPADHWKYFQRSRIAHGNSGRGFDRINRLAAETVALIKEKGPVCSRDLNYSEKIDWYWAETNLSRAVLETLYFRGKLVIHHKEGTRKYYAAAEDCLPPEILAAPDPYDDDFEHLCWRLLRRIASVGLLWNRASDAFLNIDNLNSSLRTEIFRSLLSREAIRELRVEGIREVFYYPARCESRLQAVRGSAEDSARCEFLAPLDNLLWDRKLVKALFDFDYKWEIYTPQSQRKYGYYTLPVLYGDSFAGRIEAVNDRKAGILTVRNFWYEDSAEPSSELKEKIRAALERFRVFHGCSAVEYASLRMRRLEKQKS